MSAARKASRTRKAGIGKLAVIRLDGDLYSSTMDALDHLYPKLSPGGYVIVGTNNEAPRDSTQTGDRGDQGDLDRDPGRVRRRGPGAIRP